MITVFTNVMFPVLFIFGVGYVLGKLFKLDHKSFSTLSLYLLTPCLVFQALYQYPDIFSMTSLKIFLTVTIVIGLTILAVEIATRIFHFSKSLKVVLVLTLTLTNSGNFGLPISEYAYGDQGLYLASLLLVIYVFYTHTLGVFVASSDKGDFKSAFSNMLKIPVFYALAVALILNYFHIEIPKQVFDPIKSIGLAAIPLNLVLVGINLSRVQIHRGIGVVTGVSLAKLILVPVLGWVILKSFGISGMELKVALTQIAMPSAVYCSILASHFDSDSELASEIVLVSLLLSALSLTGIITLMLKI